MTTEQSPPTTLSEERLKELKELYSKATPGEWSVQPISEQGREYRNKDWATLTGPEQWNGSGMDHYEDPTFLSTSEAEYIVALHNAFPSLLHAAEQMASAEAKVAKLRMTLAFVLASAQPNGRDNPAMYCAWQEGMKTLAETLPPAPEKGGAA